MHHLHLCLFFLWGKYYEICRRLLRIRYKYVEKSSEGSVYTRPGRLIMAQILISLLLFLYRICKSLLKARSDFLASLHKWKSAQRYTLENPQQPTPAAMPTTTDTQNDSSAECSLCYGQRENTTSTVCGHLFCWQCVQTSVKIKPECPQCREPCLPQQLVLIYNL